MSYDDFQIPIGLEINKDFTTTLARIVARTLGFRCDLSKIALGFRYEFTMNLLGLQLGF